jgi:tetratricopeptide (TPR) repeat protein
MIKCLIVCGVLILTVMTSQNELPFTETVSLNEPPDQYSSEVVTAIYLKKGTTYECENHTVRIDIIPQLWDSAFDMRSYKDVFFKVLVAVTMTDAEGKITADFVSYLNCTQTDCDDVTSPFVLVWDHAGEMRADKAGEVFDEQNPVIVSDAYYTATIRLVQFLQNPWFLKPWLLVGECGEPCISDVECVQPLRGLTLQVRVDYTQSYLQLQTLFEEAAAKITRADELAEQGSLEEAAEQYLKAEAVYERLGDDVRGAALRGKIHELYSTLAEGYEARGDGFFQSKDFAGAVPEYEKARDLYVAMDMTGMVADIEKKIERCNLYQNANAEYDKGLELLTEARNAATQEESLSRYREAREKFEEALNSFLILGDQDKVEKCTGWIDLCDKRTGPPPEGESKQRRPVSLGYWLIVLIGGGLAALVVGALWLRRAKVEESSYEPEDGSDPHVILKRKLAAGEISSEEYERIRKTLFLDSGG